MSKFLTGVAIAVMCAASAQAADQFDLLCKGVNELSSPRGAVNERHYIMDLKAGFWCYRDSYARKDQACYDIRPFVEVTPSRLLLQENRPGERFMVHYIMRDTGRYADSDPRFSRSEEGTCVPAPFSGLPSQAKF